MKLFIRFYIFCSIFIRFNLMKTFLLIALPLFVIQLVSAQDFPIDPDTKKISYSEVMTVAGVDKNTLYARAKQWASAPGFTKVEDDKEGSRYTATGQIKVHYNAPMRGYFHDGVVNYKVIIAGKDGKYKYEITDLTHYNVKNAGGKLEGALPECGKYTLSLQGWGEIKTQAKAEIPKIISSLKAAMEQRAPEVKKSKDDW